MMTSSSRAISKLVAAWLVFLTVSPYTRPFSMTDLISVLHHNAPVGGHVVGDALVKVKTTTAPAPVEHVDSNAIPPSITLAVAEPVTYDSPAQRRAVVHRILRL